MEVIGIDHGNASMKTAHFSFPSGVVEYEHEPYTRKDVLEYGGRYYVCGTGRQPLLRDKTANGSFYILTLAAIAKELKYRNAGSCVSVIIAAGLPLTSYGRDKKAFKRYLMENENPVCFCYEGERYEVSIEDVMLFPQAYAALSLHTDLLKGEPSFIVADIGGWTVDVMRLDKGLPNAATCRSLELGMIRCFDEISEQVRRSLGLSMTAAQIEAVLQGESASMDAQAKSIILSEGDRYAARLLSAISESGFDAAAMPIIFMGGGAGLMKRRVVATKSASLAPSQVRALGRSLVAPLSHESTSASQTTTFAGALNTLCRAIIIEGVCANAKGYEQLCGALSRRNADG